MTETRRILIVEDNEMNRDMLARRLARLGYTVALAENGRVALDLIAARPFDLVLLDVLMPELDGFEVVAALRQHSDWRTIPIVVLTARDLSEEDRRRLSGQVERVLHKVPFSRQDLLAEIRRYASVAGRPGGEDS